MPEVSAAKYKELLGHLLQTGRHLSTISHYQRSVLLPSYSVLARIYIHHIRYVFEVAILLSIMQIYYAM